MAKISLRERLTGWLVYSGRIIPPLRYIVPIAWGIFMLAISSVLTWAAVYLFWPLF